MLILVYPVFGFFRDDPSYATAWIGLVTLITGNEVNMEVRDGLSSLRSIIDAYVVTIWRELLVQVGFGPVDSLSKLEELVRLQLE
jgi:hypothetical protein